MAWRGGHNQVEELSVCVCVCVCGWVCGWVGVSKSMPDHASVSPLITERVIPKAPVSTLLELLVLLVLLLVVVPTADYIQ